MDDQSAFELTEAIKKQIELQEEANGLMKALIPALQATAQELLDLRKSLEKGRND